MTQPNPKRDFRQEVTDNLIRLLEEGTAPWQQPWDTTAGLGLPMNPTTGNAYRGGNVIHLLATALTRGYHDPRWLTYKQAQAKGWQVRKGEHGTQIEFWEFRQPKAGEEAAETPAGNTSAPNFRPMIHRVYTVFHASQIEGIPPIPVVVREPWEVVEAGEAILRHSGAIIRHDQARRAFYRRSSDTIHLPQLAMFPDAPSYYGTALHELAHWSGHPSRLNRSTLTESYAFGDTNYAQEELRAEIASLFLAAERGIPHHPASHAAYVGSWIKALQNDKNEIFKAAADAAKATDYLLGLAQQQTPGSHAELLERRRANNADRPLR